MENGTPSRKTSGDACAGKCPAAAQSSRARSTRFAACSASNCSRDRISPLIARPPHAPQPAETPTQHWRTAPNATTRMSTLAASPDPGCPSPTSCKPCGRLLLPASLLCSIRRLLGGPAGWELAGFLLSNGFAGRVQRGRQALDKFQLTRERIGPVAEVREFDVANFFPPRVAAVLPEARDRV